MHKIEEKIPRPSPYLITEEGIIQKKMFIIRCIPYRKKKKLLFKALSESEHYEFPYSDC